MILLDLHVRAVLAIVTLMFVAGAFDSLAFTYSAGIWQAGRISWLHVAKAAGTFAVGIVAYWTSLRYLSAVGVVLPEIQTLIWFTATIVGVAVLSGRLATWTPIDQLAGVCALVSLGWLIART